MIMKDHEDHITEKQYNRLKRMAEYINELKSIELKELSKKTKRNT